MQLSADHILNTSTAEIHAICQPLFKETPFIYFEYFRQFPNGKIMKLDTHDAFLPYLLDNDISLANHKIDFTQSHNLCSTYDNNFQYYPEIFKKIITVARTLFDMDNFLLIATEQKNFIEGFVFATHKDEIQPFNLYLTYAAFLSRFNQYFIRQANDLIKEACLPAHLLDFSNNQKSTTHSPTFKEMAKNVVLLVNDQPIKITHREYECLKLLSLGNTAKSIACSLEIAPRTVETHIQSIKNKFRANRKSDLTKIFHANFAPQEQ